MLGCFRFSRRQGSRGFCKAGCASIPQGGGGGIKIPCKLLNHPTDHLIVTVYTPDIVTGYG